MGRVLFTLIICMLGVPFLHAEERSFVQVCSDYLLLARPRIGKASATFEDFDIRIASQWGRTTTAEARELIDRYAVMIHRLRGRLRELGFSSPQFLQVIVEAHPEAVKSPLNEVTDSLAYGPMGFYHLPGIFGTHTLFVGRQAVEPARLETWPRTLFLSDETTEPIVAHELAHLTEAAASSRSRMWREARSDSLAYLTTGSSDLETAYEIQRWRIREDGKFYSVKGKLIRSLRRPEIRTVADIIANHNAYHDNSLIMSGVIYRMAEGFGDSAAAAFLRWMDKQENLIPESSSPSGEPKAARQEIRLSVLQFFTAINNWAAEESRLDISAWLGGEMRSVLAKP